MKPGFSGTSRGECARNIRSGGLVVQRERASVARIVLDEVFETETTPGATSSYRRLHSALLFPYNIE